MKDPEDKQFLKFLLFFSGRAETVLNHCCRGLLIHRLGNLLIHRAESPVSLAKRFLLFLSLMVSSRLKTKICVAPTDQMSTDSANTGHIEPSATTQTRN